MRRSACRGENRTSSAPNREMSKTLETTPMNSMAQQAVPKGSGQREFRRPQLMTASSRVTTTASPSADSCSSSGRVR